MSPKKQRERIHILDQGEPLWEERWAPGQVCSPGRTQCCHTKGLGQKRDEMIPGRDAGKGSRKGSMEAELPGELHWVDASSACSNQNSDAEPVNVDAPRI